MALADDAQWKRRLHRGLLRQMLLQSADYPGALEERASLPASPLEFARMVHSNVPVKFSGAATPDWCPAVQRWNRPGYLASKLADTTLAVAETPFGNADAPLDGQYFVQPYVRATTGREFFSENLAEHQAHRTQPRRIQYMQSQDNNFPREFESIAGDAPHRLAWADEALGAWDGPSAVNLWLGKSTQSVSRLHNDNYENVYIQVCGRKEVYLIPPGDAYALDERFLTTSHYDRAFNLVVSPTGVGGEAMPSRVLFPTVDPSDPATHNDIYRTSATVYRVELGPGDMLFLPALWYHQLRVLEVGEETGVNASLNYWYAASATSGLYMRWDQARMSALILRGYYDEQYFDEEEEEEEE